jgi:hypothetical protein
MSFGDSLSPNSEFDSFVSRWHVRIPRVNSCAISTEYFVSEGLQMSEESSMHISFFDTNPKGTYSASTKGFVPVVVKRQIIAKRAIAIYSPKLSIRGIVPSLTYCHVKGRYFMS